MTGFEDDLAKVGKKHILSWQLGVNKSIEILRN